MFTKFAYHKRFEAGVPGERRHSIAFRGLLLMGLVLLLVSCLWGCSTGEQETANDYEVVVSIFPYYDFVKQIVGDVEGIGVTLLIPAGKDSHSFEPTIQDMMGLQNANLLVYNSAKMEHWITQVKEAVPSTTRRDLEVASDEMLDKAHDEENHEDHENHDHSYETHIWTSPKRSVEIVGIICEALCEMAPQYKETFEKNASAYQAALEQLSKELEQVVAQAPEKILVFGDRFPFYYLCKDYGLTAYAAFDGCSSETEPSAGVMTSLINLLREKDLGVVYHIEMSTEKIAETLCRETGAKMLLLHSCHGVTKEEWESSVTYLQLMQTNLEHLRQGLLGE